MSPPDIPNIKPKNPLDPEENNIRPKREARRRGRSSLVSAGRLITKATGVKSSLLG